MANSILQGNMPFDRLIYSKAEVDRIVEEHSHYIVSPAGSTYIRPTDDGNGVIERTIEVNKYLSIAFGVDPVTGNATIDGFVPAHDDVPKEVVWSWTAPDAPAGGNYVLDLAGPFTSKDGSRVYVPATSPVHDGFDPEAFYASLWGEIYDEASPIRLSFESGTEIRSWRPSFLIPINYDVSYDFSSVDITSDWTPVCPDDGLPEDYGHPCVRIRRSDGRLEFYVSDPSASFSIEDDGTIVQTGVFQIYPPAAKPVPSVEMIGAGTFAIRYKSFPQWFTFDERGGFEGDNAEITEGSCQGTYYEDAPSEVISDSRVIATLDDITEVVGAKYATQPPLGESEPVDNVVTVFHMPSGVAAGSYGEESDRTVAPGGSFVVTRNGVNATGHVTNESEVSITLDVSAGNVMMGYDSNDRTVSEVIEEIQEEIGGGGGSSITERLNKLDAEVADLSNDLVDLSNDVDSRIDRLSDDINSRLDDLSNDLATHEHSYIVNGSTRVQANDNGTASILDYSGYVLRLNVPDSFRFYGEAPSENGEVEFIGPYLNTNDWDDEYYYWIPKGMDPSDLSVYPPDPSLRHLLIKGGRSQSDPPESIVMQGGYGLYSISGYPDNIALTRSSTDSSYSGDDISMSIGPIDKAITTDDKLSDAVFTLENLISTHTHSFLKNGDTYVIADADGKAFVGSFSSPSTERPVVVFHSGCSVTMGENTKTWDTDVVVDFNNPTVIDTSSLPQPIYYVDIDGTRYGYVFLDGALGLLLVGTESNPFGYILGLDLSTPIVPVVSDPSASPTTYTGSITASIGDIKQIATVDQIDDLSNDINVVIGTKVVELESRIDDLSNDVNSRLDDLSNDIGEVIDTRLTEIEGRIDDLSNDVYAALGDLSNDIHEVIDAKTVEIEGRIDDLSNDLSSAIDDLSNDLRSAIDDLSNDKADDGNVIHKTGPLVEGQTILTDAPSSFDEVTDETYVPLSISGENGCQAIRFMQYCSAYGDHNKTVGTEVRMSVMPGDSGSTPAPTLSMYLDYLRSGPRPIRHQTEAGFEYIPDEDSEPFYIGLPEKSGTIVVTDDGTVPDPQSATDVRLGLVKLSDAYDSFLNAASGQTAASPMAVRKNSVYSIGYGYDGGGIVTEFFLSSSDAEAFAAWFNGKGGSISSEQIVGSEFNKFLGWGADDRGEYLYFLEAIDGHSETICYYEWSKTPIGLAIFKEDLTDGALAGYVEQIIGRYKSSHPNNVASGVDAVKTVATEEQGIELATSEWARYLENNKSDKGHTHPSLVSANGNVSLTLGNDGAATISDGSSVETIATMDDLDDLSNDIHSLLDDMSNDRIVSENGMTTVKAQDDGIATVAAPAPAYAITFDEGFSHGSYTAPAGGETITFVGPYPLNGSNVPVFGELSEGFRYFYAPNTDQLVNGIPLVPENTWVIMSDHPYRSRTPYAQLWYANRSLGFAGAVHDYGGGNVVLDLASYVTGTASIAEVSSETVKRISVDGHTHEEIDVSYDVPRLGVRRHSDIILVYDDTRQMDQHPMFRSYEISGSSYSKYRQEYLAFSSDVPVAGTSVPYMDSGNGARGTSNSYSREDHVHPVDRTRATVSDLVNHEHKQIFSADGNSSLKVGNDGVPYTPADKQEQMAVVASMSFANPSTSTIHGTVTLLSNDASSYSIDEWNNGIGRSYQPPEEYNDTSAYAVGTTVRYNNVGYVCIVPTFAGIAPTNSLYWNTLPTPVSIEASVTLYIGPSQVVADERCTLNLFGGTGGYCDYRVSSSSEYIGESGMEFDGANVIWFNVKTQPSTDPTATTFLMCTQSTDISYRTATVTREAERPLAYKDAIASEYVAGKVYTLGDACYHNGMLYVCAVNRTVDGSSWNSSEWVVAEAANPVSVSSIDGKTSVEARNDGTATITTGKELKLPVLLITGGTSFHDHPATIQNKTWSEDTYIDFNEATVIAQPDLTRYSVSVDGWTYNLLLSAGEARISCGANDGSFWSFEVTDYDSYYPRATINPSDTQYFTGDFRLSRQFGAVSKVIATLDDIGEAGVQSVNGDTGPDVRLDATNLYMDSNDQVTIAEAVSGLVTSVNGIDPDPDTGGVLLTAGDIMMGYESNDIPVTTAVENAQLSPLYSENRESSIVVTNSGYPELHASRVESVSLLIHENYSVSYGSVSYSTASEVTIPMDGAYERDIDGDKYYFWLPTTVQDPSEFNPFDGSSESVWYFWKQVDPADPDSESIVPEFLSYANGPQYTVNGWYTDNTTISLIAGSESGDSPDTVYGKYVVSYKLLSYEDLSYDIPFMDGDPTYGSSSRLARADHVHPSDSRKVSQGSNHRMSILPDGSVSIVPMAYVYETSEGISASDGSITPAIPAGSPNGGIFCRLLAGERLDSASSTSGSLQIFYRVPAPGDTSYNDVHLLSADVAFTRSSSTSHSISVSNIISSGEDANGVAFDTTTTYQYITGGSSYVVDYTATGGSFVINCGPLAWVSGGPNPNTTIEIPSEKTLATTKYVDDAIAGIPTGLVSPDGKSEATLGNDGFIQVATDSSQPIDPNDEIEAMRVALDLPEGSTFADIRTALGLQEGATLADARAAMGGGGGGMQTTRTVAFLDSPAFTGTPTAPDYGSSPATTSQVATIGYVDGRIGDIDSVLDAINGEVI